MEVSTYKKTAGPKTGGRVVSNGAYRSRTGDLLLAKKNINTDFASLAVEKRLFPADTEGDYTLPVTRVAWWPPMERQMATNLPPT